MVKFIVLLIVQEMNNLPSNFSFVKCPECSYVIRTKKTDECQCPITGGGCGARVTVKGNVIKV